ncbi:MAG: hypothetical protein FJ399_13635 [Verrucomicrobia bacterium]|nr:hypothetical protein [Verrucomicrobiota bacterium]
MRAHARTLAIPCLRAIKERMVTETQTRSRSEASDERLRALYRAASPTEKLAVVARINASLTAIKEAAVASQHPEWSPAERRAAVRRWWLTARD